MSLPLYYPTIFKSTKEFNFINIYKRRNVLLKYCTTRYIYKMPREKIMLYLQFTPEDKKERKPHKSG